MKQYTIFVFSQILWLVRAQIAVRPLGVHSLVTMQRGLGWPHHLEVAEGHEALIRVALELDSPDSCVITSPDGQQFHVNSLPNERYTSWSDGCGLRIRSVAESDEGRWRVNVTKGDETVAGWTELIVFKGSTSYTGPDISLLDGQPNVVELTTLNNSYCVVAQPFSESSLVPGHCRVTLDRVSRAVQGNWSVILGLPGQVEELHLQRRIAVAAERLDTGYIRDTSANKLHIYCNILHTVKNITFCRFQKTTQVAGFNVVDGLSDGRHSYYGAGFIDRECGMTIEQPTVNDYGTWRCSVGVQQWVDGRIQHQTPLQALISVGPDTANRWRYRDDEIETVFVEENNTFTVMCRAGVALTYCWFQHPNGTQFTPGPLLSDDQPFWYTGQNLQTGDCGITFTHASLEENGLWTCHMGPSEHVGLEKSNTVEVRVTGPLAANKKEIVTAIGDSITLYCHTSNGKRPLDYCRFLTPDFTGFRIDPTITEDIALLSRYYFTPDRDLDHGDCSLTIKAIEQEDIGEWTCAALIASEPAESRDTIVVYLTESRSGLSQAGIAGMVIGLLILVGVLIGFGVYKMGWLPRGISNSTSMSQMDMMSMSTVTGLRSSLNSASSESSRNSTDGSGNEVTINSEVLAHNL